MTMSLFKYYIHEKTDSVYELRKSIHFPRNSFYATKSNFDYFPDCSHVFDKLVKSF